MNLNNELGFQRLVDEEVRPYFDQLPFRPQRRLKETFRYALTQLNDQELEDAFDDGYMPIELPDGNVRDFYELIWRAMFGQENFEDIDLSQYVEVTGTSETMWK